MMRLRWFQSQTRSRPSCHQWDKGISTSLLMCFNLKREAAPVATSPRWMRRSANCSFNLKREAAPVATLRRAIGNILHIGFNLKREAAPVATACKFSAAHFLWRVSISNEKPPQLPLYHAEGSDPIKRAVSISNEKPPQLPPLANQGNDESRRSFNLKREAAPVATATASRRFWSSGTAAFARQMVLGPLKPAMATL